MARSRNIKPGFFWNDELAELDALTRLLALGLPCIADREGRLHDRPKRIKAQVLPYDDIDINAALDGLVRVDFIQRYTVDNIQYIQIVKFSKHQNPHKNEAASTIPEPPKHSTSTVQAPDKHSSNRADSLNLIPDSLQNTSASGDARQAKRFAEWWAEYPNKKDKKKALAKWKARQLDRLADTLISDTKRRKTEDRGWLDGFVPLPTTYINGDRWEDAIEAPRAAVNLKSMTDSELLALAKQKGISTDGLYRNQLIDRISTA